MFGWFKKDKTPKAKSLEWIEYKGFQIAAAPVSEGGQYRVGGKITKGEGESLKERSFLRADLIPSQDEAKEFSITKAKLMVDQLGDRVFDS